MNSEPATAVARHSRRKMLRYERECWSNGATRVVGIDEAGRGPLAGPVVAAAVVFPREFFIPEVNDSKALSIEWREELYDQIMASAVDVGVGIVENDVIDQINILNATFKAMHGAIAQLLVPPNHLLIDGNRFPPSDIPFTTIVDGDALCFTIAAASIVAKVTRDRLMTQYDEQFPGYGFAKHKGYATPEHVDAIYRLGYCGIHRKSFHLKAQLELQF